VPDVTQYRFYEKVVKVKADVAAIPNSFPSVVTILVPLAWAAHR
jgi:hypothetical protein